MTRTVNCPTCSKPVEWKAENRFRPFCSERCKKIDLGAWANEEYRVAQSAPTEDESLSLPPEAQGGA
ncbi:MAG TPA: DNA gyrase inhibitor YacG [Rhodocyclaceae bacterium]|nr:DNA gyrase inhibitor YacG [Rhodocyclaceae bacterium]